MNDLEKCETNFNLQDATCKKFKDNANEYLNCVDNAKVDKSECVNTYNHNYKHTNYKNF